MATDYIDSGGKNSGWVEQMLPIVRSLPVPTGVQAGDPVLLEEMVCYAQSDRDGDGNARVMIPGNFVQVVPVSGRDNTSDVLVAVGNLLYFDAADDQLNLDSTAGVPFGYALAGVVAGETTDIEVVFGQ